MKPSEKIMDVRRLPIILCTATGIDPFNNKIYPQFAFVLMIGCTYMVMFVNGCYESLDDPYKFLHALVPVAIIITLFARFLTLFVRNWMEYDPTMKKYTLDLYEKYENDPRYTKILAKRAAGTEFFMKFLAIVSFCFFHLPLVATIVPYVVNGQKVLFLNNYLPYTDPTETFDFFLNLLLQTFLLPMAFAIILFADLLFVMYGYNTATRCDIMCCHIEELAEDLIKLHEEGVKMANTDEGTSTQTMTHMLRTKQAQDEKLRKLEKRFIDIVLEHKAYEQYLNDLFYYTEIPCIAQVWCNSISIGIAIVLFFKHTPMFGIAGCLIFSSIVVTPCIIGTWMSHQNERLANHLLDFPYFDMSKGKQKVFLQFIHAVSETPEFTLPIFGTVINLEAFTDIMNTSYSYFTFFATMAEN